MDGDIYNASKKRALYTGEPYSVSMQGLRKLNTRSSSIPNAATQQALLETDILLALNMASYFVEDNDLDASDPPDKLLLISGVHPGLNSIRFYVNFPQLYALLPSLLPCSESPEDENIMGVKGLRAKVCKKGDTLLLSRPTERTQVEIRVTDHKMQRRHWRRLLQTVRASVDVDYHTWYESPETWTASELAANGRSTTKRSNSAWLCSGILRRLNMFRTSGQPLPTWVDAWDALGEDEINLQLEWPDGPPVFRIRDFLLDKECGMHLEVVSKGEDWMTLRSTAKERAGQLVLRHNLALSSDNYIPT